MNEIQARALLGEITASYPSARWDVGAHEVFTQRLMEETPALGKRAVTRMIRERKTCPSYADLCEYLFVERKHSGHPSQPKDCPDCGATGWREIPKPSAYVEVERCTHVPSRPEKMLDPDKAIGLFDEAKAALKRPGHLRLVV